MKVEITGTAKEIAALVLELQERHRENYSQSSTSRELIDALAKLAIKNANQATTGVPDQAAMELLPQIAVLVLRYEPFFSPVAR